jgi:type I phosphodiesterase/nucleotide pyrophosphatase
MTARRLTIAAVAAIVSLAATVTVRPPAPARAADADLVRAACALPHDQLLRTWRGWRQDRGANLQIIPREPHFVGSGLPHVGPWDYIQTVPMFWYGPGFIQARGMVGRPVTVADIAPTQAELLHFDGFRAPDGEVMSEALQPTERIPKLVVVMVWDAGGINVLEEHRDAWPYLRSLIPQGTWYEDATVGSSPTSTAQIHATMGTGAFPNHHGLLGHRLDIGGEITTPWDRGPAFIVLPTFADIFDRARGNRPVAGVVGTVNIHFGMLGHGAYFSGGDRDVAMTRSVVAGTTLTTEGFEWNLPKRLLPYYRLADYANQVTGFRQDKRRLDQADGKLDGNWRDNPIAPLLQGFDTPARTPYQQRVVETVIRREGFGADETPDLLYLNFKEIDYISHVWSMNSPEMRDAVVEQDRALKRLVAFLDREVGREEWAMAITADHAAMPDPATTGAFQISSGAIAARIQERFDGDQDEVKVVRLVQPSQLFLDVAELESSGGSIEQVARYVMTFTQAQMAEGGVRPNPGEEDQPVFAAVIPSTLMRNLPCLSEATGG